MQYSMIRCVCGKLQINISIIDSPLFVCVQICDTFDEEDPEGSSQRHLAQTPGRGERKERQLRP